MIIIPVCGYRGSDAERIVSVDIPLLWGSKPAFAALKPLRTTHATPLKLGRMLHEWEKYNPGIVVFFHWDFDYKKWSSLWKLFCDAKWIMARVKAPMNACLHNLTAAHIEGRAKNPPVAIDVLRHARALDKEIKQAAADGLRICDFLYGVPSAGSIAKLRRYVETIQKELRT